MANVVYNSFKKNIGDGTIDWDDNSTTTIKCMLVTSSYSPDIDLHSVKNDITNEVSGTGYTAGGNTVANRAITQDNTNDWAKYDGDDVVWSSSSITARGAVLYKDTGDGSTSPLVAYIDFGTDQQSVSADFTIQWNADGIFTIS